MRAGVLAPALLILMALLVPRHAEAEPAWPPREPRSVPSTTKSQAQPAAPAEPAAPPEPGPPPGFHVERRYIVGLIVPGAVITFVGTLVLYSSLNASANADADFRNARAISPSYAEQVGRDHAFDRLFTVIGVAHLLVGVPLLTIGILVPRHVNVPNRPPALTFAPMVGCDRVGGTFALRF